MKKLLFLFFTLSTLAYSQTLETWTWDSYKMKFKVPSNFEIITSTGEEFTAGNDDVAVAIVPQKGDYYTERKMKSFLDDVCKSAGVTHEEFITLSDLNGYSGVMCDGYSSNLNVFSMMIVDPDYKDICFYISIIYTTAKEDLALEIAKSFTPN